MSKILQLIFLPYDLFGTQYWLNELDAFVLQVCDLCLWQQNLAVNVECYDVGGAAPFVLLRLESDYHRVVRSRQKLETGETVSRYRLTDVRHLSTYKYTSEKVARGSKEITFNEQIYEQ